MVLSPYRAMIVFSHVMMIIPQNDALKSCKKTNGTSVTILLSCNSTQWIHVKSETFGNASLEQGCLNTANSCTKSLSTDADGLIVTCNGKQTCNEHLQVPSTCTPIRGTEINYDCVEGSLNVCSAENKSTNGFVYLHSPGFPDSDGVSDSCTCRIRGTLMLVQLIEHRYRKKDLDISTDGNNLTQGIVPFNRIIVQRAGHITLNYQGMEDGRFWIKVAGSGMIDVKCSNDSNNMPSTSMATTTTTAAAAAATTTTATATATATTTTAAAAAATTTATAATTTAAATTTTDTTKDSSSTGMDTANFTSETLSTPSDTTSLETTTTGNSSESSDTESSTITMIRTTKEETPEEFRAGPLSVVALASIGAAGGFVVLVLIVVGVICCRRLRMSKVQKGHIITDHNYFQLDPDFVSLNRKEAVEEASTPRDECQNVPHYVKVSRSSRGPAYDNNTLNDGDDGMLANDIYISRPPSEEQPKEGMVDNFLYHIFRHSDTTSEATSQSPVMEHDIGDKDKGMVISDLNHGDQTSFVDQNVNTIAQESHQTDPRCSSDGEGTTDRDAVDGMVVNDLYHSYQASPGNQHGGRDTPALSAQTKQPDNQKQDEEEDTARMVINDFYHSYQSPQKSPNPNMDHQPKSRAEESDNDNLMVENDLYYTEVKPCQDGITQQVSGGHYDEIVNNELVDPGDLRDQGLKPRPPAYEDIADITSVR